MAWTYSGDPSASTKNEVRFLVADTNSADQLVSDEEIAYAISQNSSTYGAAIIVARAIAMRLGVKENKEVGDLKISASKRAATYLDVLRRLEESADVSSAKAFMGGISTARKDSVKANADRVAPTFSTGMMANTRD